MIIPRSEGQEVVGRYLLPHFVAIGSENQRRSNRKISTVYMQSARMFGAQQVLSCEKKS
nr:hypothetical protein [uncultured Shinella sp.]